MAGVTLPDMRPWGRQALTIPPNSRNAWIHLAIWELWMGMIVCVTLGLGVGQPCQQLAIATGQIGSERAVVEDDRRAHAARRSPAG